MGTYVESGMDFRPLFHEGAEYDSFYIEKSDWYKSLKDDGVKTVEFISNKNQHFYFIEAKGSFPNVNNPGKEKDIEENCQMLSDKLHHTLDLIVARRLKVQRHLGYEESEALDADFSSRKLIFLLVMGQNEKTKIWFKEDWCDAVRIELRRKLIPLRSIWNIEVAVIDNEVARKLKMIV